LRREHGLNQAANVALHLNVRLRPFANITAVKGEIHGCLSLKLAAEMRLMIRADLVRESRRQWFRNERGSPHHPTLEFCDDFSVGSPLSPQFPSQVVTSLPFRPSGFLLSRSRMASRRQASSQRFCSSLSPSDRPLGPRKFLPTLRAVILNLSAVWQGRVSYLTTESQFNCRTKQFKTLSPASRV
jgi:hypothetical protein